VSRGGRDIWSSSSCGLALCIIDNRCYDNKSVSDNREWRWSRVCRDTVEAIVN
jgi:hypothetical protein